MIVGVRKNVPFVVKAVPESKIEGKWLSGQIVETIQSLHEIGFHVRAVISDNHPRTCPPLTNISQNMEVNRMKMQFCIILRQVEEHIYFMTPYIC